MKNREHHFGQRCACVVKKALRLRMNIDLTTGDAEICAGLVLRPGMTRDDVLIMGVQWQEWNVIDGISRALRVIIKLPNEGMSLSV